MKNVMLSIALFVFLVPAVFSQELKNDNFDAIGTNFIANLASEQYETAYNRFDATIKSQFKLSQLESIWQMLLLQHGDYEAIVSVEGKNYQANRLVFINTSFKNSLVKFRFFINEKGFIGGFFIDEVTAKKAYVPPDYADTNQIITIATEFGDTNYRLPAIITLPKGREDYPFVILVHGSGPQDKDETIGPNKIFKDIALGLAANGIGCLRYEKRTMAHANKLVNDITIDMETVDDAVLAVKFIKSREDVRPRKIYVLGHSLGGYMSPKIAQLSNNLDGIILMGGCISPLEDLILMQTRHLSSLKKDVSDEEMLQIEVLSCQVEMIKQLDDVKELPNDSLPLGIPVSYWKSLRHYNPVDVLNHYSIPVLIIQAEKDYQVPISEFSLWQKSLSGRQNTDYVLLKGLNHLFMNSNKPGYEDYFTEGHVSVEFIKVISEWLNDK